LKTATKNAVTRAIGKDALPRFSIGHLSHVASDVSRVTDFYRRIGMRIVVDSPRFSILELRGGTHIVVQQGRPVDGASLDLMVDDIDDAHAVLASVGADPGPIARGNPHDRFVARDPEGTTLYVSSSHAQGLV